MHDLGPSVCFLGMTGSHAYGMAREDSDVDVRGACIPPYNVRESPFKSFAQVTHHATGGRPTILGDVWEELDAALQKHPSAKAFWAKTKGEEIDLEVDAFGRLTEFMVQANPNKLELLFLHPEDILVMDDAWATLRASRDLFLSKRVKFTYAGYAFSQLKRIKGHRAWLMGPPLVEPKRGDFGLPESTVLSADDRNRLEEAIKKIIRNWGVEDGLDDYIKGAPQDVLRERMIDFQATVLRCEPDMLDEKRHELAGASVGLTKDVLYALKMERKYRGARKAWEQFKRWERERNEKRAVLEATFGFDTKHGAHLIRLLRTGLEILNGKGLIVKRPDAQDLLDIRDGAYSYDDLVKEAENLDAQLNEVYKASPLPDEPDTEAIERIYLDIVERSDARRDNHL